MKKGDFVLFYHSNEGKEVVGIAKVVTEAYQDPTTTDERWVVVGLAPVEPLKRPVTLEVIKADPQLQAVALVRQGRLSVMPLKREEFDRIVALGAGNFVELGRASCRERGGQYGYISGCAVYLK